MKKIYVLIMLITFLFVACGRGATLKTFADEFPDRLFRKDVLALLNDYDGGARDDSSSITAQDFTFMAKVEKLDVSGFNHRLFDLAVENFAYRKDRGIESLKGIEYFTGLKELSCSHNQLKELDMSKNTALTNLYCINNQLEKINLTKNSALEVLLCHENYLEELDMTKNTALRELGFESNRIVKIDLSRNVKLNVLKCYNNRLTKIDLSKNSSLEWIDCTLNYMKSTDDVVGLSAQIKFEFEAQWPVEHYT